MGDSAGILGLPTEILELILDFFKLELPPVGCKDRSGFFEEFRLRRSALHSLCLTSRLMSVVARPRLYETVIHVMDHTRWSTLCDGGYFWVGAASMVRLIMTLIENPELVPLIKHMAFPFDFHYFEMCKCFGGHSSGHMVLRSLYPFGKELLALVAQRADPKTFLIIRTCRLTPPQQNPEVMLMPERLLAVLVSLCSGLRTLRLEGRGSLGLPEFNRCMDKVFAKDELAEAILPNLTELQLGEAIKHIKGCPIPNKLDPAFHCMVKSLVELPTLKTLRIEGGIHYRNGPPEGGLPSLQSVQHLELEHEPCPSIVRTLYSIEHLDTLRLRVYSPFMEEVIPSNFFVALDHVLASFAPSLRVLRFINPYPPPIWQNGAMECLPILTRLESLTMDARTLLGVDLENIVPNYRTIAMHEVLPPKLVEFELELEPGRKGSPQVPARIRVVVKCLYDLAENCVQYLPKLRVIKCAKVLIDLEDAPEVNAPRLQEAFGKNGVNFTWN